MISFLFNKKIDLKINVSKKKVMIIDKEAERTNYKIEIYCEVDEEVNEFVYLGDVIYDAGNERGVQND